MPTMSPPAGNATLLERKALVDSIVGSRNACRAAERGGAEEPAGASMVAARPAGRTCVSEWFPSAKGRNAASMSAGELKRSSGNFSSAVITWSTDEASDSQVVYGTTSGSYPNASPVNASAVTSHGIDLGGLSPSTTYFYQVKSKDAAGNLATSAEFTFVTTAGQSTPTTENVVWTNKSRSLRSERMPTLGPFMSALSSCVSSQL